MMCFSSLPQGCQRLKSTMESVTRHDYAHALSAMLESRRERLLSNRRSPPLWNACFHLFNQYAIILGSKQKIDSFFY